MPKPTDLEPSKLGTKEYWDALYETEIANHAHDPADTGTVWFDDSDAEAKLVEFLEDHSQGQGQDESEEGDDFAVLADQSRTSFLDLGTGNGALLFCLRDAGWGGPMLGVDYSPLSVEFARRIERRRRSGRGGDEDETGEERVRKSSEPPKGRDGDTTTTTITPPSPVSPDDVDIHFQEHDILHSPPTVLLRPPAVPSGEVAAAGGFDVVLDKGTFDAVSLSAESNPAGTGGRINETYGARVLPLVREGGLFLVTSCNWTEAELEGWFAAESSSSSSSDVDDTTQRGQDQDQDRDREWCFKVVGRVVYRSFSFGGVKGQTISSLCFRKVRRR